MNNVNKDPSPSPNKSDETWAFFFQYLKNAKDKFGWLFSIFSVVFVAGIAVGRFYENLQNKFEISELKTQHKGEIEKIRNEILMTEIKGIKETQNNLMRSSSEKEVTSEK